MSRRFPFVGLMVLPFALCGCANISRLDVPPDTPSPEGNYRPSVDSIAQRIRCELKPLADEKRDINLTQGNWVAVAQLSLDVVDDGSLAPTFTYTQNPIFSFGAGAKFDVSREQNVVIDKIYEIALIQNELKGERIGALRGHEGANGPSRYACPAFDTNLSGDLGITTTADLGYRAEDLNTGVAATANGGVFGGYVQFIVTKNLNAVGPTWALQHFKGPGGLGGVSEVNTDKVTFAFALIKPEDGAKGKANAIQTAKTYIQNITINQLTVDFSAVRQNTQ